MKGNSKPISITEAINNRLISLKQEALQIGINNGDIGLYYDSRSDLLTDDMLEDVLELDSSLVESVSMKNCKDTINRILVRVLSDDSKFTVTDLESFLNELKSKPLITYSVLTSIYV